MGRAQRHVYRAEPPHFPPDFPGRLECLGREAGLGPRALARALRVDARTLRRWRKGTQPGPGYLYRLFAFAARHGFLHCLLPGAVQTGTLQWGVGQLTAHDRARLRRSERTKRM